MMSSVRVCIRAAALVGALLVAGCTEDPAAPPAEPMSVQPLIVPLAAGFTRLSLGGRQSCALNATRVVECWGVNNDGPAPSEVYASTGWFTQVSAGGRHACALRNDGAIECWGDEASGFAPALKTAAIGSFTQVSVYGASSCALRLDGKVECWGLDQFGDAPALVEPATGTFTQVTKGGVHSCALRDDGVIECWGANGRGEAPATKTAASGWFTQVGAGFQHTCAVRNDGIVECWGLNDFDAAPAFRVPASGSFIEVDAEYGTCGVRDDGEVECWGWTPLLPTGQSPTTGSFVQVGVGLNHVCSLRDDGVIECVSIDVSNYEDWAPPFRYATTHVIPTATFNAPANVNETGTIALSMTGAAVAGYPSATNFTYAFDCGDGSGYGAFSSTSTASCAAGDGPENRTVKGTVRDEDGDSREYTAVVGIINVAPTVESITLPGGPVALDDQPVNVIATFSDPAGADDAPYTCTVDHGDLTGPQAGVVSGMTCTGPDHTYTMAGLYTVVVDVTDKDGGTGAGTTTEYVVIYDPDGGFVTGAGWIDSPAGAYAADPVLSGKAIFAFVSKYTKGKNTPGGTTQFRFIAAGMQFLSESYDWLVVNQGGTNAQFRGRGTINGEPGPNGEPYRFMLWATDGAPDTFRIRIWSEDANGVETVVYDNGFGQPIGAGTITVHTQ